MTGAALRKKLAAVRGAAESLRSAGAETKNLALEQLRGLLATEQAALLKANAKDLKALPPSATAAFRDRLTLTPERLSGMRASLAEVERLADPVGEEVSLATLPNGLIARRVRAPLGVILMIYESRPNVAIEAFSLAFKAGNAIVLRGGRESRHTVAALYALIEKSVKSAGLPADCLWGVTDQDRKLVAALLKEDRFIDVVVPRGGEGLISFVTKSTRIPVIKNDRGLCHVYVHEDADEGMALIVTDNAKTSRPAVCNSAETLLVHRSRARGFLPALYKRLRAKGVEFRACTEGLRLLGRKPGVKAATAKDFHTEHLDLILNVKVVGSLAEAIEHIREHGSRHSECIITQSAADARRFQGEVDAAAVYWNASTRFTDGFELGLGGELGISTQKLHARGPVGLRELTSARWILDGKGQIR